MDLERGRAKSAGSGLLPFSGSANVLPVWEVEHVKGLSILRTRAGAVSRRGNSLGIVTVCVTSFLLVDLEVSVCNHELRSNARPLSTWIRQRAR